MTIASETNRAGPFNCNGATTAFPGNFKIDQPEHVRVLLTDAADVETELSLHSDYTVAGVGLSSFTINTTGTHPAGKRVTLLRSVPFTQEIDLQNQGAYYAETVERAFDLGVARDQQLAEEVSRAVKIPASSQILDLDGLVANIERVGRNEAAVAAVAEAIPAVQAVAAFEAEVIEASSNMPAILAAPGHAATADEKAGEAAGHAADAAAAVASLVRTGAFTPQLKFGGNNVGMTYGASHSGRYTRIGRLVFAAIFVHLTAKGSSTGSATITGLPFPVAAGPTAGCASVGYFGGITIDRALYGVVFEGTDKLELYVGGASATSLASATAFTGSAQLLLSVVYETDAP
ncbi:MAG: hypothetical protein F2813_00300 [Actinobacteria bacterium]|uniref:Unannotated protein n=1 Tax=freshwater metagenome TaxID=449393 RepID=A0A6J5YUZ3_9ZZZZ|nr:hypothetical protein [Actinomycetota bacterium]